MINNAAATGLIAAAAGAAGATAPPHSVMAYVMPIVVGCLSAAIVRGIAITTPSKRKRIWMFEALVTALSVLLTGVVVADQQFGIMHAAWVGLGIGGLGVGVITIAKSAAGTLITNLAKSVLASSGEGTKP